MIAGMPPRRDRPRVAIATPATAEANNGNWRTAERWAGFLVGGGGCEVSLHAGDDPVPLADADALIALHAVKSRAAIDRFRADRPGAPLAIVLTGTDVYGADGTAARGGEAWRHAAESASALVVLPVAMQVAQQLHINPRPFAIAIMLAASVSLITPFEPSCILVYGPGKYRFKDFLQTGSLLTLIMMAVIVFMVPMIWKL